MGIQARISSFARRDSPGSRLLKSPAQIPAQIANRKVKRRSGLDVRERLPAVVRCADLLAVTGAGVLALRFASVPRGSVTPTDLLEIVFAAILFVSYLSLGGAYRFRAFQNTPAQIASVSLAWGATIASLYAIGVIAASGSGLLRPWMSGWILCVLVAVPAYRIALELWIKSRLKSGGWAMRVAVVGGGTPAFDLARRLRMADCGNVEIVGIYFGWSCALPGAGTIDDLYALANAEWIDQIVIALPWASTAELNSAVRKLCTLPVDVKIYPGMPETRLVRNNLPATEGLPFLSTIQYRPLAGWGGPLKRAEDILLAALLLCMLSPLVLLIGLLVRLSSPGPALFRQERFGFNNNKFFVFKFRSMYHSPLPDPEVKQAQKRDPRITPLGAFLRKTSLDELPQLLNVLGGSMSLVGPRPHATPHNKKYGRLIDGYIGRHRMKPGITGQAQVNGHRGETDTVEKMNQRLQHDLFYIDNWSLFLDMKILAMTIPAVIFGRNAY